jgi:septal ring factor EnvC (AmiA/AmiB activator)
MRSAIALCALGLWLSGLALAGPAAAPAERESARAELDAARKTEALVADKLDTREAELGHRVRALYKLTRAGLQPLWLDEGARGELARRRAAARRLIVRDLEERRLLREELDRAQAQTARLEAEVDELDRAAAPDLPRASLRSPVPGRPITSFGVAEDPSTGLRLYASGVELASRAGQPVTAPAAGTVRYAGPLHGLGQGVLVEPAPGVLVLVAGLSGVEVDAGAALPAGARLGAALSGRVTLAFYRDGRAVDPLPYLAR